MTIVYSSKVATTTYFTFLKLLFMWKGSVYRLIHFEFLVFLALYTALSLMYRLLLTATMRTHFELLCVYCSRYGELIPVPFVLGFYVSMIVSRWWDQFLALPWPDQLALYLTAYCHGNGERPTRLRRTVMRYVNLSYCIGLRAISSRARLRFPSEGHLVTAGLMTQEELDIYLNTQPTEYPLYFAPLVWALDCIAQARYEGLIRFDRAVEILTDEVTAFRGKLGTLFGYDWVNPPLVYTQTATITVYSYFIACLFSWQYLDPSKNYPGFEVDIYIPLFGLLRFFFYIGWLKVAESLLNPFGEDEDDFEIEYLIERNLNVSYLIVDGMHHEHPDLVRDAFWSTQPPSSGLKVSTGKPDELDEADSVTAVDYLKSPAAMARADRLVGSLAHLDVHVSKKRSLAFWRNSTVIKPFTSVTSIGQSQQA